jgi:ABC-type glycerol-3-phosphate transport system permease component
MSRSGRLAQLIIAVAWSLVALIPFLSIALLSFRTQAGIYLNPFGVKGGFDPSNYSVAWNGPVGGVPLYRYLLNSAIAAAVCIFVGLAAGSTAAFRISRLDGRQRQRWRRIFLMGALVPIVVLILPLFLAADRLGLLNSALVLGVLYGALSLPTIILILESYFEGFPMELTEAARLDGLSSPMAFLRIVLPLSRGAMVSVSMLVLIFVWSEAQLGVVLLGSPTSRTVAVGMLGFVSMYSSNTAAMFAGLSVAVIPIMALYFAFNKQVMSGVTIGGTIRS